MCNELQPFVLWPGSFFDGETQTLDSNEGFFLAYLPGHTIQGGYTNSHKGTKAASLRSRYRVGGNGNATLYSLTGLSVTKSSASSSNTIFNQIDATAPFAFTTYGTT